MLLIYLALRRRSRPILWTLAFAVAYTLAGSLVLGSAPSRAFFEYQLPRLASAEAFHALQSSDLILAANASVYSIPFKLQRLGVLGMPATLATVLTWPYTALLVGALASAARRHRAAAEPQR